VPYAQQVARKILFLLTHQTGRGLVKQQQFWLEGERTRHSYQFLHAVRQACDRCVAVTIKLEEINDALDDFPLFALLAPCSPEIDCAAEHAGAHHIA
jgi:hypothetical protein